MTCTQVCTGSSDGTLLGLYQDNLLRLIHFHAHPYISSVIYFQKKKANVGECLQS